ncbi:chemotaxis protein CheD [Consotaella salsifontis]|uniref:Probable chemoreceptor glutamine deamidase CheD n=1 Tax=Consotaella salsifontis TaxID=1365950 RepID=A0A1T4T994_9HYPH|nr:chemotaxis protein CheD [Consotaella salsifontis]SKA37075.1 chemotaxis protein CheD [Consotaella salsifontis]
MNVQVARRRITIIQGEWKVEKGEDVCLTTLLGSCVAACIRDPGAGIGGMNHFLLPGSGEGSSNSRAQSYGLYLMELLINGLLKKGARRNALEAKIFGGARTVDGLSDVGAKNAAFAKEFLANEGIPVVGGDLGGDRGRRIEYWPASGRARQILLDRTAMPKVLPVAKKPIVEDTSGDLELF